MGLPCGFLRIEDVGIITNLNPRDTIGTREIAMNLKHSTRLNIGCGLAVAKGWTNIDRSLNIYLSKSPRLKGMLFRLGLISEEVLKADWRDIEIVRRDVTKGIPCEDNSVCFIYCSHMLEHLSRTASQRFLEECHRILTPDGILRLAVPDLHRSVSNYYAKTADGDQEMRESAADCLIKDIGMFPANRKMTIFERLLGKGNSHLWAYDFFSISRALRDAGFSKIVPTTYHNGTVPDLDKIETREDSLFVEASK